MVLCIVSKLQPRRPKKRGSISTVNSSPALIPIHLSIHLKIAVPSAGKLHVVPKLKMLRALLHFRTYAFMKCSTINTFLPSYLEQLLY